MPPTDWKKSYEKVKRYEFEVRQKIPECTLCPHLGVGEPLVDKQAQDIVEAKELLAGFLRVLPDVLAGKDTYPELTDLANRTNSLLKEQ